MRAPHGSHGIQRFIDCNHIIYLNLAVDSEASSGKFSQASVPDFGGFVEICRVRFMH